MYEGLSQFMVLEKERRKGRKARRKEGREGRKKGKEEWRERGYILLIDRKALLSRCPLTFTYRLNAITMKISATHFVGINKLTLMFICIFI